MGSSGQHFIVRRTDKNDSKSIQFMVAWSADFADVGPTLACQPTLWLDVCIFCRRWADVGPTLACQPTLRLDVYILPTLGQHWANGGFLFKMAASNNRGFGVT